MKIIISYEELEEGLRRFHKAVEDGQSVELSFLNHYFNKSGRRLLRLRIGEEEVFLDATIGNLIDVEQYLAGNEANPAKFYDIFEHVCADDLEVIGERYARYAPAAMDDGEIYSRETDMIEELLERLEEDDESLKVRFELQQDYESSLIGVKAIFDNGCIQFAFDLTKIEGYMKEHLPNLLRQVVEIVQEGGDA